MTAGWRMLSLWVARLCRSLFISSQAQERGQTDGDSQVPFFSGFSSSYRGARQPGASPVTQEHGWRGGCLRTILRDLQWRRRQGQPDLLDGHVGNFSTVLPSLVGL